MIPIPPFELPTEPPEWLLGAGPSTGEQEPPETGLGESLPGGETE